MSIAEEKKARGLSGGVKLNMTKTRTAQYCLAGLVSLLTLIVYAAALNNDFVDLDDNLYVFDNPYLPSINIAFLRWVFLDFYAANWHPLTWMSHGLDFAVWGLNPLGHHLTSIMLHAVNTFLAALLAMKLVQAANEPALPGHSPEYGDTRSILAAGAATGLLFGLHPLHVESVAWISERKDLLCAMFFFLSIAMYMKFAGSRLSAIANRRPAPGNQEPAHAIGQQKFLTNRHYLFALGFFLLALLSKPMAVTLPLVLLILDWHPYHRMRSLAAFRAVLVEKLPFVVLSLASSIITIMAQKAGDALRLIDAVPLPARLLVAIKSYILYLVKTAVPYHLVPYYPYPDLAGVSLSHGEYTLALALFIGITLACLTVMKRRKVWLSVWCYFVITLIPVIGIIQVGGQAMADRYTYLPSFGPFLIMGLAVAWVLKKIDASATRGLIVKAVGAAAVIAVCITLSYLTFRQIGVWKNSMVLFDYIIEKEPDRIPLIYNNRGILYGRRGLIDDALQDFNRAIAFKTNNADPYYNRGLTYARLGQNERAVDDFTKALELNQRLPDVYFNRGQLYLKIGQRDLAREDFKKACDFGEEPGCNALRGLIRQPDSDVGGFR